jgi:hypothetical protein
MSVANIEVDLTNYSGRKDFFVYTEYIDERNYNIVVKRLDTVKEGWAESLKVFVSYLNSNTTETVTVGSSSVSEKKVLKTTDFNLSRTELVSVPSNYSLVAYPEPQYISRKLFNAKFNTDIVTLPKNIFAVGVRKGNVYIYCESNEFLYMIELTIKHLVTVALTKDILREFHFLICAFDGYMEHHYYSERNQPKQIGPVELQGVNEISMTNPNEYAVLHKDMYVLGQSNLRGVPYTFNIPDRYYFYLNRYNEYRSIHQGIPFLSKKSQITFGSQPRGSKYNFINRKDIDMSPRQYFYSNAVSKENIVCPDWIPRKDMIQYRYILDIDGNASTWDATAWKLNSGSVIMKSDSVWSQWFYNDYQPWVHYVPVNEDFSDIQEKFNWCESHPSECMAMIANCKALFQKIYRFNNVIESSINTIYKANNLVPYIVGNRRVFLVSGSSHNIPNLVVNQFVGRSAFEITLNVSRKLKEDDIVIYLNTKLTDLNNFNLEKIMDIYDSINTKVVFGAEKNLWPGELESVRYKIESVSNSTNEFKYLNAGFYIAEVGELARILDERVYEMNGINEQEYFARAYITKRYSMSIDTNHKLVLNTFRCSSEEINTKKTEGVPFIHFNAGR